MLRNYIKIALRNIKRQRIISTINIAGFTFALVSCIYILLYVFDELKYDQFNIHKDRVVRFVQESKISKERGVIHSAVKFDFFFDQVPEFEKGFRLEREVNQSIEVKKNLYASDVYYADKDILQMMTFPLIRGNEKDALETPFSVVLTESLAKRYFNSVDVIGKLLKISNHDYQITGVLKNIPVNSHIHPEIIASFQTLKTTSPGVFSEHNQSCYFYFLLNKKATIASVESKLNKKLLELDGSEWAKKINLKLEPLGKIYLYAPPSAWDIADHGSIQLIQALILISVLVLIMAIFNYSNIITSLIRVREKEYIIRKILGADKQEIIKQFLLESLLNLLLSTFLGFFTVIITLPFFNLITGKAITIISLLNPQLLIIIVLMVLSSAIVAAIYPLVITLKSKVINVLNEKSVSSTFRIRKTNFGFRQIVICLQFIITIGLIAAINIIYRQLEYAKNERLGFNKDNLLVVENPWGIDMGKHYQAYTGIIQQSKDVISFASGGNIPSENINNYTKAYTSDMEQKDGLQSALIAIDYDYFKTLGIKLVAGRLFSADYPGDTENSIVVTKSLVKKLNIKNPIGSLLKGINNAKDPQTIIGVVDDIHFKSFKEEIKPIIFYLRSWSKANIIIKISSNNVKQTVDFLSSKWNEILPSNAFVFRFVDEAFNKLYIEDNKTERLILAFCIIAIVISSIGLFGFALLSAQMKRKEIGIRRVVGATVPALIFKSLFEYVVLIILAAIISIPITQYLIQGWLEEFVYRIDINVWFYVVAVSLTLLITIITVGFHAYKAAIENPINSLRYE